MKTTFLKTGFLTLIVCAFALFTLASCEKDDDMPATLKQQLVGTWDFTSFKLDTSEYMGSLLEEASIQFHTYTGTQGNFQQKVTYVEGESETIDGKYEVDEAKKEVKMTHDGETTVSKITITNGNKMELKSTQDGEPLVIKASKE